MPVLSCLCRFVKKYFECDLLVIAGSQLTHAGHVGPFNLERLPFIRKFRWKFSVKWYWQFFCIETGIRLNCAIYKIPANFRFLSRGFLALVIQTNGTENFGCSSKSILRTCLHGVGDPGLVELVSFVFTLWRTQTKETYPTRPGSPTPCQQGLTQ